MKRLLALVLAVLMLAAVLDGCAGTPQSAAISANIRVTSSDATDAAAWLTSRLGDALTDRVVLGTDSDGYGVDVSALEDDGYIIRALGGEVALFARTEDGLDRAVRKYAKTVEAGELVADEAYHEGARIKSLTIGGTDIAEFVISLPAEPSGNMTAAAAELSKLIALATGVALQIETDSAAAHAIRFETAANGELGDYGYEYEVADGSLILRGAGKYGAVNAVRRFCENELDWRSLIFGEAELMPADAIDVAEGTKKSEKPAFDYLYMYYNAWGKYDNPVQPSNVYGDLTCAMHGMQNNRFANVNEEQICFTSQYRYDEVHDNVCDYIDRRIEAGGVVGKDFLDVDIAQGDYGGWCNCRNCRQVIAEEGGNAGLVVRFANKLSEEINEVDYSFDAPLYFKIFAYSGTNKPPKKTAPNEYIYVTFCTDMNCSNHPLDGSECTGEAGVWHRNNKEYAEWLEGWCAICQNMYVWVYALDTMLAQYTVTDTIYKDFRYLADLGVKGIFWQCQFHGLGIQRVEHQLLAELNWNMEMTEDDFEALLCDILRREYGDGWRFIREYLDVWNAEQDAADCWDCWSYDAHVFTVTRRFEEHSVAAHFDECYSLFESAIAAADSRADEIRLKQLSCHMIYEGCYSCYRLALEAGDEARIAELSRRYDVMVARLAECGFDISDIMTVDGHRHGFEETLFGEFSKYWAGPDDQTHGPDPWYEAYFKEYSGK